MNQLYGNRRKIKLVRERTQNTKIKTEYNTKQKMKRANSRGAGKKSLHKPELVGQSTHNKSKLNNKQRKKIKGVNLRRAEGKSTAQARCW